MNVKVCKRGHERENSITRCPVCRADAVRAWKQSHPERMAEINRKHSASYAARNPEKIRAMRAAYRENNRERENAMALASYYRRKAEGLIESTTERVREWRKANPERAYDHGANENARRRRVLANCEGSHTSAEWRAILERQQGFYRGCGDDKAKLEKDHIVPLSKGGTDYAWNLQGLCRTCNARKGAQLQVATQLGLDGPVPDHLRLEGVH